MNEQQRQVAEFHRAMGLEDPKTPAPCDARTAMLRFDSIREELDELDVELGYSVERNQYEPDAQDLAAAAKEIADLLYVVYGTANALGIDIEPVFNEVHRSNMTKYADGRVNDAGKLIKGPGYSPARIRPILKAQGMK